MMIRSSLFAASLIVAPFAFAQEQRVFRDWVATCDNTRHCSLIGLSLVDSERWIHLRFERSGEPSAGIGTMHIEFGEPLVDAGEWSLWSGENRLFVVAEGERRCGEPYPDDLCDAILIADEGRKKQILRELRRSDALTLVVDDEVMAGVSLDGASAALLWMDDRQGRVGSETALVHPGDRPTSALAQPPAPPEVRVRPGVWLALAEERVRTIAEEILRGIAPDRCDRRQPPDPEEVGSYAVQSDAVWQDGEGRMLTSVSCYGGAYNFSSIWFIRFGSGSWQEVDFPRPVRGATETGGELINAGFDPASGLLESFNKGRGYGDCGTNAV